ncbi:MAG TPA: TrkA C-terminal domain-containing protein [Gaiellaceae bacterium]|nr:TrkA C-terminal domain-containing protein [Gaiellaceae bacterium]
MRIAAPGYQPPVLAIASLLVVVLISLIVTRVATVALIATGLSREMARFQSRSAFTGTGFTTTEAESVVNHPVRRRIVLALMLAGNAGLAAVVASLMLGFTRGGGAATGWRVLELIAGLAVLLALARSRWVDRRLSPLIGRALSRWTDVPLRDYAGLLELDQGFRVLELAVRAEDWLAGRTLAELSLRDEGVVVLGIRRGGGWIGVPDGSARLEAGDTLVLYGHADTVCALDDRRRGAEGDAEHARAVRERARAA